MGLKSILGFVVLVFVQTAGAAPAPSFSSDCGTATGGTAVWTYCVTTTAGSHNTNIVYELHGGGGNAHSWETQFGKIRQLWADTGVEAPIVATISFGPKYLLIDKNSTSISGYYDVFVKEVMPTIETQLLPHLKRGTVRKRQVIGNSMGGFNAAELLLKSPDLFDGVVLLCPMLMDISPAAPIDQIKTFSAKSNDPNLGITGILGEMKTVIPDDKTWNEVSPFVLAKTNLSSKSPRTYLTYGDQDGFVEGIRQFDLLARTANVPITTSVVSGYHCAGDQPGIAKFLAQ